MLLIILSVVFLPTLFSYLKVTPLLNRIISSKVSKAYLNHSRCKTKEHIFTDLKTASLIKYSINTFLATKVIFFNEIFSIFKNVDSGDSWEQITTAISIDARIGDSHMDVPGHDGKLGFGGACLPKDSNAIYEYGIEIGVNLDLIKKIIILNNSIRKKYDSDDREKIQNISYD